MTRKRSKSVTYHSHGTNVGTLASEDYPIDRVPSRAEAEHIAIEAIGDINANEVSTDPSDSGASPACYVDVLARFVLGLKDRNLPSYRPAYRLTCDDCSGLGIVLVVTNAPHDADDPSNVGNPMGGIEVQRCETCERYHDNVQAAETLARIAGVTLIR